jgi:hypothetical protein
MKRLLILLLSCIAVNAYAGSLDPIQYGVPKTIPGIDLLDANGLPLSGAAASSVALRCNGGTLGAGSTTRLTELGTSGSYTIAVTSAEASCAFGTIEIASTPAHVFTFTTYGCFSAYDRRGGGRCGLAQAGTATTITLDAGAAAVDDLYRYRYIDLIDGTGVGQRRLITQYVGSTKVATVNRAWDGGVPDTTTRFALQQTEVPIVAVDASGVVEANAVAVAATGREDVRTAVGLATANTDTQLAPLAAVDTAVAQLGARDAATLNCTVNATALTPTTTTFACALTDRDGTPVTSASGRLRGRAVLFTSGTENRDMRFTTASTVWDAGNSVLQITVAPALISAPANGDTAQIF